MNKHWSDAFDSFKTKLTKKDFKEGIYTLLKLRESLYRYLLDMKEVYPYFDYVKRPLSKDMDNTNSLRLKKSLKKILIIPWRF